MQRKTTRPGLTTLAATGAVVMSVMPVFLIGASAVLLGAEFGISESEIGLAVGTFYAFSALSAILCGRLADRSGAGKALAAVMCFSSLTLLGVGAMAYNLTAILLLLGLAGIINGMAQPASNMALAHGIIHRQGLVFGIKQSAIPLAALLAGVSVPLLGVSFGWRWAFLVGATAVVPMLVVLKIARIQTPQKVSALRGGVGSGKGPLAALALAMGLGTASATGLVSFLVPSATAAGFSVSTAGWLAVIGSLSSVLARLAAGWYVDRVRRGLLPLVAVMLMAGSAGYSLLAFFDASLFQLGTIVAYSFGWGWTGLLMFAAVRLNANAPGAASGVMQFGGATGAAAGPILFGLAAEHISYQVAWTGAAGAALVSSLLVLTARRRLRRNRIGITWAVRARSHLPSVSAPGR